MPDSLLGDADGVTRPAPMLGEHTREVLREYGYSDERRRRARSRGCGRGCEQSRRRNSRRIAHERNHHVLQAALRRLAARVRSRAGRLLGRRPEARAGACPIATRMHGARAPAVRLLVAVTGRFAVPPARSSARTVSPACTRAACSTRIWTGAGGFTGSSLNAYDAERRKWHQTWVDNSGGVLLLDGEFRDGRITLAGRSAPDAQGIAALQRITWTPLADGRVRQLWESSKDAGATWTTAFDGYYTKAKVKALPGTACQKKEAGSCPCLFVRRHEGVSCVVLRLKCKRSGSRVRRRDGRGWDRTCRRDRRSGSV